MMLLNRYTEKMGFSVTLVMPERVKDLTRNDFSKLLAKHRELFEKYAAAALGSGLTALIEEKRPMMDWSFIGQRAAEAVAEKLSHVDDVRGHLDYVTNDDQIKRESYLKDFARLIVQDGKP
jgi:hypothetical protein